MRFPVVIHKEEGACYGVTVPDLLGCISAGDTADDALENVKEAITGHVESMVSRATGPPKSSPLKSTWTADSLRTTKAVFGPT